MGIETDIIVVGGNHHNTIGVIRSLGRVGLSPYVIITTAAQKSFVLKSKYIKKGWLVNGSQDAIELLLKELANNNKKSILIGCHDEIAYLFDQYKKELDPFFYVPSGQIQGTISYLMDKKEMSSLAKTIGFNVPYLKVLNNTMEKEMETFPYPCITKPIESRKGSKSDIKVFRTKEKLMQFLSKIEGKYYIVQHFVEKDFEYQLIGCSVNYGAEIIIPGISKIIRPSSNSNTGFLCYTKFDESFEDVIEKTELFIKQTGYSGLFSVEFLRDKNGDDFFMEMNFRNDGNSIAVTNAGVNLPLIWCYACQGLDYHSIIGPIHEEYVMPEFAELYLHRYGNLSRCEWKKDLDMTTSYMDFAEDDPAPTNGWNKYRKEKVLSLVKACIKKILLRN